MQGIPHIASTPHDGRSSPVPPARGARPTGRDMTPRVPYEAVTPRTPYEAPPHAAPVTRHPWAADPQLPVFIDESGWRRRALQGVAVVVSCACVGYLLFVGTLMSGLLRPVGTQPPSTNESVPAGPDTGKRAQRSDASGRTGAHADRDSHRRPTSGRSAEPPAGGPGQ